MGECHYLDGNVKAEKIFQMAGELIEILGIEQARLRLEWISSAEGVRFAEVAREFTAEVKSLGPSAMQQAA